MCVCVVNLETDSPKAVTVQSPIYPLPQFVPLLGRGEVVAQTKKKI